MTPKKTTPKKSPPKKAAPKKAAPKKLNAAELALAEALAQNGVMGTELRARGERIVELEKWVETTRQSGTIDHATAAALLDGPPPQVVPAPVEAPPPPFESSDGMGED